MFISFSKLKHYFFIIIFFITKISNREFNNNVNERFFTNTTAMIFFRFRDFEPRYESKLDPTRPFENKRKSRGFQFHTDDRDFSVDLEFIVPFIRIPIERSVTATQTALRSLLNLNVQSIFTTGAIVAIGGVFAIILKIIFTQFAFINNYRKSFRSNDLNNDKANIFNQTYDGNVSDYILNINKFATVMESKFQENNINIKECIQSSLCNFAQDNFYNASKTPAEGLPRILDGILSLDSVMDLLSDTSIKSALDTARNGENCYKIFNKCNLSLRSNFMLKFLAENFNYFNIT